MTHEETTRFHLPVGGMTCGGCARAVERALRAVPGVQDVEVALAGHATIGAHPGVAPEALAGAVRDAGFEPGSPQVLPAHVRLTMG